MKFEQFENRMRRHELHGDSDVMPDCYFVIRLDGRSFSKLTKDNFSKPFDPKFVNIMEEIAIILAQDMQSIFAFTQSDEISLLFPPGHSHFGRNVAKLISTSAGLASALFSTKSGILGIFDARIATLPSKRHAIDYFRWRQGDCIRNALNTMCYWELVNNGSTEALASKELKSKSHASKLEMLFARGINYFESIEPEHRNGIGVVLETYEKEGFNPKTNEKVAVARRRFVANRNLPVNDELDIFLNKVLETT